MLKLDAKRTFFCTPQKTTDRLWKIFFLSFSGVAFKLVAGTRNRSDVGGCQLTLQKPLPYSACAGTFCLQCVLCLAARSGFCPVTSYLVTASPVLQLWEQAACRCSSCCCVSCCDAAAVNPAGRDLSCVFLKGRGMGTSNWVKTFSNDQDPF